jgi:hypothetical protein
MEQNVALTLHAQLYGKYRPDSDDDQFHRAMLREHSEDFAPIIPPKLAWGPRCALEDKLLASLDSKVMHVFVYMEGKMPKRIEIIGEGLPEIREIVYSITYTTSLRVWGLANDIMNIGALSVELPGTPVTPLDLPMNVVGDIRHPMLQEDLETAETALFHLLELLRNMARNSGLIEIHEAGIADHQKLSGDLKKFAGEAKPHQPLIWAPGTAHPDQPDRSSSMATFIPYWQIRSAPRPLGLSLSPGILKTSRYEDLFDQYHLETIQRILADVRTRKEYYTRRIKEMEQESQEYAQATPAQRRAVWGTDVSLTQKFDVVLGIWIQLPSPEVISIEKYFETNIPHLIDNLRKWFLRMQVIDDSIIRSVTRSDAPDRRFAASRFLDAAIRERRPDGSAVALESFDAWSRQVQPMIWFEWRCHLRRIGIDPAHVFTRHSFFHTRQFFGESADEKTTGISIVHDDEHGPEVAQLFVSPYTVIDRDRSVVLYETANRVMVARDATDFVEAHGGPASGAQTWESLEKLAEQPSMSAEKFHVAFRDALRSNPAAVMTKTLTLLTHAPGDENEEEEGISGAVQPESPPAVQEAQLRQILAQAAEATAVSRGLDGALTASRFKAIHTARQRLDALTDPHWQARVDLVRAIVECIAEDLSFVDELPLLADGRHTSTLTSRISAHLQRARAADPKFVDSWLSRLGDWGGGKSISALLSGLPRPGSVCPPDQMGALLAKMAVETAATARELQKAATALSQDHEYLITAYAKLGRALEQGLLSEYGGASQSELAGLLEVLTARVPLSIEGI